MLLSVDRKKTAHLFGALYAGQALYLLMLMATYMFFFAEDEAQWLAEFDRYVSLPALLIALTACMALTWNEGRIRTRSGAAMLAMAAAMIPLDHPELMRETFITREAVIKTLWENSGTDSVVAFLRENMELSTMRRLYLMGDCRYIFLYEQLMPQAMVEEQRADSMEAMQKRLDEGRYDYAFVGNLEPDGFLAQGGLQANTLYAVVYDEAGRATLEQAAVRHPYGCRLYLLTAPVGLHEDIRTSEMKGLLDEVRSRFDYCLIDSGAGLGDAFRLATCAADRAVVVATTDPTSLRDAQRTVMELRDYPNGRLHLVVNRVRRKLLKALSSNIDDAIDAAGLPLLGVIPEDEGIPIALGRSALTVFSRESSAEIACRNIARRLTGERVPLMKLPRR